MPYPPDVERWRELVSAYFAPEDVNKALWVILHESGGNSNAIGDSGSSLGLFQLNINGLGAGLSEQTRFTPSENIRQAAIHVATTNNWTPWGEGALFRGEPFGSLGNKPYPGDKKNEFAEDTVAIPGQPAPPVINLEDIDEEGFELFSPSGENFEGQFDGYTSNLEFAEKRILNLVLEHNLSFDPNQGYGKTTTDELGDPVFTLHEEANMWSEVFFRSEQGLERISALRDSGLTTAGRKSAEAFLDTSILENAAGQKNFDDFRSRIDALAAVENIPIQRATDIASM
ncbi:hypothetical protein LCGC14_1845170, partial [marine sediment metagenome]